MEESHPVMYEASTFAGYSPPENVPTEHVTSDSETPQDDGNAASADASALGHNLTDTSVDRNSYARNPNSTIQDASVGTVYDPNANDITAGPSENHATQDNIQEMSLHFAGYGSLNGTAAETANYQSASALEKGAISSDVNVHGEQPHQVVYSPEEERLWNMVRANCLDFDSWTALIEETEKVAENDIMKIQGVYDAFLAEFPLCYGYWKKYADHEGHLTNVERVIEVYERAVLAATYSVDIWLHYAMFAITTYEDPDTNRRLFERGLAYVGTDYQSHQLWDEYIRYEESHQAWSNLALIYTRILEHPIQQLDWYFNCFKGLAASHPLSEIRTPEEAAMLASTMETAGQVLEGEARSDGVEQPSKLVSAGLTEAEQLEKYIAIREEMYRKAKEFDSKIIGFETAIRRPYFHVKPLDDAELENWQNYLDFMERGDDFNKLPFKMGY